MFYGECLRNGVVFKDRVVKNLSHMIVSDADVKLELFHVTWMGYNNYISMKAKKTENGQSTLVKLHHIKNENIRRQGIHIQAHSDDVLFQKLYFLSL